MQNKPRGESKWQQQKKSNLRPMIELLLADFTLAALKQHCKGQPFALSFWHDKQRAESQFHCQKQPKYC